MFQILKFCQDIDKYSPSPEGQFVFVEAENAWNTIQYVHANLSTTDY